MLSKRNVCMYECIKSGGWKHTWRLCYFSSLKTRENEDYCVIYIERERKKERDTFSHEL